MKTTITFLHFSLHLEVTEFQRSLTTKDFNHYFQFLLLVINLLYHAAEA